jgi:DNA relaxase NicK
MTTISFSKPARQGCAKGSHCNTSLTVNQENPLISHLDYLSGSLILSDFDQIISLGFLLSVGRPVHLALDSGVAVSGSYFPHSLDCPSGLRVGFESHCDQSSGEVLGYLVRFSISGEFFALISGESELSLLRQLNNNFSPKITRIDLAIDDYAFSIPVESMARSWKKGNHMGFRQYKFITSGNSSDNLLSTHYFGSRKTKCVRIYTHIFSDSLSCQRFEAEFHGSRANSIFQILASVSSVNLPVFSDDIISFSTSILNGWESVNNALTSYSRLISAIALGAVDFRTPCHSNHRTRSNTKRSSWWLKFINRCSGSLIAVRIPIVSQSLQKTVNWLFRQVSTTFSLLSSNLDDFTYSLFLSRLIQSGSRRLTKRHSRLFDSVESHQLDYILQPSFF